MTDYLPWTIDHMAAEEMQKDWNDWRFQDVFHDAYKEGAEYVKHYADKKIEALEAELAALKEQMRWRDFSKERPKREEGNKIIAFGCGYVFEAEFCDGYWCSIAGDTIELWLSLPAHPTTSDTNKS